MKRILAFLLMLILIMTSATVSYGQPQTLSLIAKSAILIDAKTGEILYEMNSHQPLYPASTTKMLTGILALENLEMDELVPIDAETPFTEGSRIYLLEGEQINVRDTLYGLLLESANDAAVALAKMISGSVSDFAVLMNAKAQELGARNSNFVNPNGLHDDEHLSTAYDMAMIAKYAMENPVFRDYVSTYHHAVAATNMQEIRYLYNTNRLLYDNINKVYVNGVLRGCEYEGVTGIKTGYTSKAGGCLVAGAKRGETELIAVVLGSTDMGRFSDCISLLDYGFANFKTVNIMKAGSPLGTVQVKRGAVRQVEVATGEESYATLPIEASEHILRTEVLLDEYLHAPVKQGQKAGTVQIYAGEELLGEFTAVALEDIEQGGMLSIFGIEDSTANIIRNIAFGIMAALILVLVLYILFKRRQIKRKKLLRQQLAEQAKKKREQERARWEEQYKGGRSY